ncbi:MAG: type II secretion system F family protein [Moorellales bacterium]
MHWRVTVWSPGGTREVAVEAESAGAAAAAVRARLGGARALVVRVVPARKGTPAGVGLFGRPGPQDLAVLCRNLAVLLAAGVTALEALEIAAAQTPKRRLAAALALAAANVREGLPLKDAFRSSPGVFPEVFCQVVEASEEAGALEAGLESLASHFEREAKFRERLRQALAYPTVVAALAVAVALGLFIFVVPKFAGLLAESGAPLPLPTRLMLGFARHAWEALAGLAGAGAAFALGLRAAWKSRSLRPRLEAALLRLPFAGALVSKSAAARACRTLALLLRVGVPAVAALESAERTGSLALLARELAVVRSVVRSGGSLAAALARCRRLPPAVGRLAAVGEKSGTLPEMLERAAALSDVEAEAVMQRLPLVAEGGMLVCVGGLVLFVLLSLFLPIVSMYQAVK